MLRVRPGVELVLASFLLTSDLMTLDFPTFERPRKATSGKAGAGKRPASVAASKNWARTRTNQFPCLRAKLQATLQVAEPRKSRFSLDSAAPGSSAVHPSPKGLLFSTSFS